MVNGLEEEATTMLLPHTLEALAQVGVQDDAVKSEAMQVLVVADRLLTVQVTIH